MGESTTAQGGRTRQRKWDLPIPVLLSGFVIAATARLAFLPYVSEDSTYFLIPWMQEFRDHGAAALSGEFSNYNFPYLLLMFLAGLLPVEPLIAIKVASLLGDALLAVSVYALAANYRTIGVSPKLAALIALFLPTVLVNASMWGQCDAIYTAFLVLSLRSLLRNDGRSAWLLWGIAFAFKLQSVFFLPALLLISLRNRYSLRFPLMAFGVWAMLSLPPAFFGRSLASTFSVYINQTQEYRLVAGAANVYAWFPTATAEQGRFPALVVCGTALLMTAVAYWRGPDTTERRVLLTITVLAVCPLLLPQMHDRYFFAAEVMALLLLRHKDLFLTPWFFATTGALVYVLYFLSNQYALPLMLGSVVQCLTVGLLFRALWRRHSGRQELRQPTIGISP